MPVFETSYGGQAKARDGALRPVPPQAVLRDLGPFLPVVVSITKEYQTRLTSEGKEIPNPVEGSGLIDTGASMTAVDEAVCQRLGLQPTALCTIGHAGGQEPRLCYPIQILFPGTPLPALLCPTAVSVNLRSGRPQAHILLLGRDLLAHLRMVYNGPMGRIEVMY